MSLVEELTKINVIVPSGQLNKQSVRILNSNPDILQLLNEATSFISDESIRAKLFAIRNGIDKQPVCLSCGAPMKFNLQTGKFNSFCPNVAGSECSAGHSLTQAKRQATNVERYGTDNPTKLDEVQDKRIATMLTKYGTKSSLDFEHSTARVDATSPEAADARKRTNLERYGASTWAGGQLPDTVREVLDNKERLTELLEGRTIKEVAELLQVASATVSDRITKYDIVVSSNGSSYERTIKSWLDEYQVEYVQNDRTILDDQELDFYIPSRNLAIEINGVYFHSELKGKGRNYHLNKHQLCRERGIQLIQIWHFELDTKPELIKSKLKHLLGITNQRVYARKCEVRLLSDIESKTFLDRWHIQGNVKSSIKYGLIFEDKIVAVMTFAKSRYNKNVEYELMRYATSCSVVGGASKLLKHFIRGYQPKGLVSYCDLRWGTGKTYIALGFKKVNDKVSPNYHYFNTSNATKLLSRVQFQKHKLVNILDAFDPSMSEWENMKVNGYDRVWDCGSDTYILE